MRLISYNLNGIRATLQKGLLDFIQEQDADIYCFQETKAQSNQIQFHGFEYYPYWIWASAEKAGYSGVATFSKIPFVDAVNEIGITRYDREGRFNIVEFEEFTLYNIYFPNGGMSLERHFFKMDFLKDLLLHLEKVKDKPIIVTGDYNIAHKDIDVYDPIGLSQESGFRPEERAWMDQLSQLGFVDCFRELHPDAKNVYSWWSYKHRAKATNSGWRIDYFFVSESLRSKIKNCYYLPEVLLSDHCPVVLELSL